MNDTSTLLIQDCGAQMHHAGAMGLIAQGTRNIRAERLCDALRA